MNATKENDIAEIDLSNENPFIKDLKEKVTNDMKKTAVSNINNERMFIDKKLGRKEKTMSDVTAYYKEQSLKAEEEFNNYYFIYDETRPTGLNCLNNTSITLNCLNNTLENMDTDLNNINNSYYEIIKGETNTIMYDKNLDEEIYKMIIKITLTESIAKTMLEAIKDNYNTFKKNARTKVSKSGGMTPTEYTDILTSIRDSAITKYNELNIAYIKITESEETPDHLILGKVEKALKPTF